LFKKLCKINHYLPYKEEISQINVKGREATGTGKRQTSTDNQQLNNS